MLGMISYIEKKVRLWGFVLLRIGVTAVSIR